MKAAVEFPMLEKLATADDCGVSGGSFMSGIP